MSTQGGMVTASVRSTIDFGARGKQVGRLELPRSTNTAAWSSLVLPVACIAHGSGPTALLLAGTHGDEYEGQIAVRNLLQQIEPDAIQGRLIIIPCLSMEAAQAETRLWPDGANFNRAFPGRPDGPLSAQLADYLTRVLFPLADIVYDLHSGGRSLRFYPMSEMHLVADPKQRAAMLAAMQAWNTDHHLLYIDVAGSGLLPTEAERQGKIVVTTELGGGGYISSRTLRLTERGLRNTLRHFGMLPGAVETRASLGLPPAVILRATDADDYLGAPESGLYETLVDPGDPVSAGQAVGRLHHWERPEREPQTIRSVRAGIVCAVRASAPTQQGDVVATIGQPCDPSTLL